MKFSKLERFAELVEVYLDMANESLENKLECLDCVLSSSEDVVPESRSLRFFAADFAEYYFGRCDNLSIQYPEAARHINAWRRKWHLEGPLRQRFLRSLPVLQFSTGRN